MSDYFKAAGLVYCEPWFSSFYLPPLIVCFIFFRPSCLPASARCDITVIKNSPVPIDEKTIIEEEIKARQFDTLIQRAERDSLNAQPKEYALIPPN